jgi:molecular chaperone GrpE
VLAEDDPTDGADDGDGPAIPELQLVEDDGPAPAPEAEAAEAYHQRARLAEDRLAEVLAAYRQIKSENEGFRDRIRKNLQRKFTQQHETLLLKFIDILDNLDRALEAATSSYAGQPLLEGMILVRTQLLQRLKEEGLERVPVLGLPFDPEVAEAVGVQPVADPDHQNLVVKELMRGYRVNGRVVRPSRVLIGEYREDAPTEDAGLVIGGDPSEAPAIADESAPAPRPVASTGDAEQSIEEIVAKAEAQNALFPGVLELVDTDEDDEDRGNG